MEKEITEENGHKDLLSIFAKAGKVDNKYRSDEDQLIHLSETGAQVFKKEALGLFRRSSVKRLEEIAELFMITKIATSFDEAVKLVPKVVSLSEQYPSSLGRGGFGGCKYLTFQTVKSLNNTEERYQIDSWNGMIGVRLI